jgi:hypothetical protein
MPMINPQTKMKALGKIPTDGTVRSLQPMLNFMETHNNPKNANAYPYVRPTLSTTSFPCPSLLNLK